MTKSMLLLATLLAACSKDAPDPLGPPAKGFMELGSQIERCNGRADLKWMEPRWKAPCEKLIAERMPEYVKMLRGYREDPMEQFNLDLGCLFALRALRIDRRHAREVNHVCCKRPSVLPRFEDRYCDPPAEDKGTARQERSQSP